MKPLNPLHHYQLGVIFLFIFSFGLFIPYLVLLDLYEVDQKIWGWYFIIPWTILYTLYCLYLRGKIPSGERVSALKRPIGHWAVLGVMIVYLNIIKNSEFQTIYPAFNFAFILFSLFIADSYWDFRKLINK